MCGSVNIDDSTLETVSGYISVLHMCVCVLMNCVIASALFEMN